MFWILNQRINELKVTILRTKRRRERRRRRKRKKSKKERGRKKEESWTEKEAKLGTLINVGSEGKKFPSILSWEMKRGRKSERERERERESEREGRKSKEEKKIFLAFQKLNLKDEAIYLNEERKKKEWERERKKKETGSWNTRWWRMEETRFF